MAATRTVEVVLCLPVPKEESASPAGLLVLVLADTDSVELEVLGDASGVIVDEVAVVCEVSIDPEVEFVAFVENELAVVFMAFVGFKEPEINGTVEVGGVSSDLYAKFNEVMSTKVSNKRVNGVIKVDENGVVQSRC